MPELNAYPKILDVSTIKNECSYNKKYYMAGKLNNTFLNKGLDLKVSGGKGYVYAGCDDLNGFILDEIERLAEITKDIKQNEILVLTDSSAIGVYSDDLKLTLNPRKTIEY